MCRYNDLEETYQIINSSFLWVVILSTIFYVHPNTIWCISSIKYKFFFGHKNNNIFSALEVFSALLKATSWWYRHTPNVHLLFSWN